MRKLRKKSMIMGILLGAAVMSMVGCGSSTSASSNSKKKELIVDTSKVDTNVVKAKNHNAASSVTFMESDGDSLDEVISGAWFDDKGNPKADDLPENIAYSFPISAIFAHELSNFRFLDNKTWKLEDIKRSQSSLNYAYAVLVTDIKINYGVSVYTGTEYYTGEEIGFECMNGCESKILKGDSVLLFGTYGGRNSSDIPSFDVHYIEVHNDRF